MKKYRILNLTLLSIIVALIGLAFWVSHSANRTVSNSGSQADTPYVKPSYYTILSQQTVGSYRNYNILLDSAYQNEASALVAIRLFKHYECKDGLCNTVSAWRSREAYQLWENRSESATWRKRHWVDVCEGLVVEYTAPVQQALILPLLNETYQKYGGKLKRPLIESYDF